MLSSRGKYLKSQIKSEEEREEGAKKNSKE